MKLFNKTSLTILSLSAMVFAQNTFSAVTSYSDNAVKKSQYAIVKCSASWCGPCKTVAPYFNNLSNAPEFKNIKFMSLDTESNPSATAKYNVQSLPTFLFFKDGKLTGRFTGSRTKFQLKNEILNLKKQADSKSIKTTRSTKITTTTCSTKK